MKKLFFIIPIIFFLNVEELKVISYNIRYNNPNDGVNLWENRKSTITKFLIDENPDFAGLQEVTFSQLSFLTESLINYSFIGVGRDDGKTKGEYSPIFYNNKKYKVVSSKTFWLSSTPEKVSVGWDASMERICTYGLFENLSSKEKVWVFNTHFDHIGIKAREKSTDLILKKINEIKSMGNPIILTGDFNLNDTDSSIKKIQSQMKDVLLKINKSDTNYETYNGFKKIIKSKRRIDYIFVNNIEIKKAKNIHLKTPYGGWASDHHPVLSILKL
ncbi:MAG: endonuclease/exonuclease/phosphatase family protein [Flavobacteriaceae bacterium]